MTTNRIRKLAGRQKQRRFVQSSRAHIHAMTNSMVKRGKKKVKWNDYSTVLHSRTEV